MTNNLTILLEGVAVECTVVWSRRRSLAILVRRPQGRVEIKAPVGISIDRITGFVEQKKEWIIKKRREMERVPDAVPLWNEGAEHLFLGRPYRLRIVRGAVKSVELTAEELVVTITPRTNLEKFVRQWYLVQARQRIPEITVPLMLQFQKTYGKYPKSVDFKYVRSYWGICRGDTSITLNAELVRATPQQIAYIFCHELCHLVHRNHSEKFYRLLETIFPDWKNAKLSLNNLVSIRK